MIFHSCSMVHHSPILAWCGGWISPCKVLLLVFLDTVFFGAFFPESGKCEGFLTIATCLADVTPASSLSLCSWSGVLSTLLDDTVYTVSYCSLWGPPNNITYMLIVAMLSIIIGLPFEMIFEALQNGCQHALDNYDSSTRQHTAAAWWGVGASNFSCQAKLWSSVDGRLCLAHGLHAQRSALQGSCMSHPAGSEYVKLIAPELHVDDEDYEHESGLITKNQGDIHHEFNASSMHLSGL